jgi:hypothetical protein
MGNQCLLEGIQHKLMLKLLEFDYNIEYKKGKGNTATYALSRQFQHDDTCQPLCVVVPSLIIEVANTYSSDDHCIKLLQELLPPIENKC